MTEWHVRLSFDDVNPEDPINDQIDDLFEALGDPSSASFRERSLSVWASADTKSPEAALRAARTRIVAAMRTARFGSGSLVGIEMYTDDELDRLNAIPNYPELAGVAEAAELLGVSKQRISELAQSRRFPRPMYRLAAGPVWDKWSIVSFGEKWERKPGRPRKAAAS